MIPVTPRFLAALREAHQISVAAAVYRPGDLGTAIPVAVSTGTLTVDRDARIRRQASLDIAFPSLEDQATRDLVRELPFGGYATIARGIEYADGTAERVQLGRLRVDSIVWHELQGLATLTLNDRMAQIQDEALTVPYAPAGMHPSDAIVDLVRQVFADTIAYHVQTSPASEPVLGPATVYLDDRAGAITDLASTINADVLFDQLGDLVVRPSGRGTVAWTIDAGDHGSMMSADETLDRSSVRNGVVVRGQSDPDQPPFYALATYQDPTAPTRWGGPFGRVALISDSTTVTSQGQADATAASLLNLRLGLQRTISLTALPNPALEPDDLIELVFADGRTEQQVVNSTQIGLDPTGPLTLTTSSNLAGVLPSLAPTRMYRGRAALRELATARLA